MTTEIRNVRSGGDRRGDCRQRLPFVVNMVGLAVALVKDLARDPQVVRRQYVVAAIEPAVVAGVSEHGDFALTVQETPPGEGVGELVPTEPVAVEEVAESPDLEGRDTARAEGQPAPA